MVGKLSFTPDTAERIATMRSSSPTPGLPPLDQEREASMADEGGASGAVMENDEHRLETAAREADESDLEDEGGLVLEVDPRVLLMGALGLVIAGVLIFRARR